jgi:hypothetical protein
MLLEEHKEVMRLRDLVEQLLENWSSAGANEAGGEGRG